MALTDKLSAIGDAIREKTGTTELLKLDEMPSAIAGIEAGGGGKYKPRYITFYQYQGTELNEELANLDISEITNMSYMFSTTKLTSLDLRDFNTENVTDMSYMFSSSANLTEILMNFNTEKVTNMSRMFTSMSKITSLDLSSFKTNSLTDMQYMFTYCRKLEFLDIRNFVFDNVTKSTYAFNNMNNNCLIIVKGDTEKEWITSKFTSLTNVKTVAEYQAEGGV